MGRKRTPGLILRNGIWHIDKSIHGRRVRRSCKTSSLEAAETYLSKVADEIRNAELELNLDDLSPEEGMRRLVAFTFDYFIKAPYFINLLNSENLHQARHVRRSQAIVDMHGPVIGLITDVLNRGVAEGVFRSDADPVQVFITNASVAYFYFSNIYTLSTIIDRDLASEEELAARRRHVIDVVMGYLRPLDPAELLL